MEFTRTTFGLQNQFLFYDVDVVLYCEGGDKSWSIESVKENFFNDNSIDIIFWRNIFQKFDSDLKIKFKAVGSKTTVKAIAREIIDNNFKCVAAAMDSEFDEIHNKKLVHNNVFYTNGYSWENDVWSAELTISILEDISGENINPNLTSICFDNFLDGVKHGVYADAYLFNNNLSFFPKERHLRIVDCTLAVPPRVIPVVFNQLLSELNGVELQEIINYGTEKNIDAKKYCYGHLLNDFCYHLVRYISDVVLSIKTIHKDLLERMAIKKFCNTMNDEYMLYYRKIIDDFKSNLA